MGKEHARQNKSQQEDWWSSICHYEEGSKYNNMMGAAKIQAGETPWASIEKNAWSERDWVVTPGVNFTTGIGKFKRSDVNKAMV